MVDFPHVATVLPVGYAPRVASIQLVMGIAPMVNISRMVNIPKKANILTIE
jgi:hypothetical protein